jgi:hypothetical protein
VKNRAKSDKPSFRTRNKTEQSGREIRSRMREQNILGPGEQR